MSNIYAESPAVKILSNYYTAPDQIYLNADGHDLKLDVYFDKLFYQQTKPTLLYIHGGGWMGGSKDIEFLKVLPYLENGWNVVSVDYRLGGTALAPAAIEDVRCALRWVYQHSEQFGFDTDRLVVSGSSAGGHLALMTGILSGSAGYEHRCPGGNDKVVWPSNDPSPKLEEMPVAAIVNWFGITDVADVLIGENSRDYAVSWLGRQENRVEIAKDASPISHLHKNLPAILTIHGDLDEIVPYSHGKQLHKQLDKLNVANQLYTVSGGGHGEFDYETNQEIYQVIWKFLDKHVKKSD